MAVRQKMSTNPFEDSSSSDDEEVFHDCQQALPTVQDSKTRTAPLDFKLNSFKVDEGNQQQISPRALPSPF
jgi:hypothetical protein